MAIKESDIRSLFKVITSETMKTVSAGQKTIISPTTIRNMTTEVIKQAESGSTKQFMNAFNKVEVIIDKLGVNVSDFNKGLGKRIEELRTQRDTSAKEVEKLRADNIASETRVINTDKEFRIETAILTKKEIKDRQREIIMAEKMLLREEKEAQKRKDKLLNKETLTSDDNERILADQENIVRIQQDIQEKKDSLGVETGGQRERGASSTFLQELMMPFTAVGDALLSIRDIANSVTDVFTFFAEGGLQKSLKKFASGIKSVAKVFTSTKVLIGIAIAGVLLLMYKFRDKIGDVAAAIMKIPGKIFDFFKGIFTMIKDFYITLINGVLKLINKIPGIEIDLLKTSKDKEDDKKLAELKAKENREATALMNEGDVTNEEKKQLEKLKEPNKIESPTFTLDQMEAKADKSFEKAMLDSSDRMKVAEASAEQSFEKATSNTIIQNNSTQNNTSNSGTSQSYIHSDNKNSDNTLLNLNNTAIA